MQIRNFTDRLTSVFENSVVTASAVTIAVFAVYAFTAPRTVTLEDDGLFILAALDAGVAHPPGYPLFVFLGHLFSKLPVGEPALRLHLMSGLLGAAACGFLYLAGRRVNAPVWAAAVAALSWGLSEHFWSQAIITEVYTLNALLCIATFYFCLRAREGDKKSLNLAALCFGLGLANHWPLTVLSLVGFSPLLLPQWRRIIGRPVLIALGVAAAFYLWMVWRSHYPVMTFYGPIEDIKSFWFFLTRKGYAGVDVSESAGIWDTLAFAWFFIRQLATQITPAGTALAVFGIYAALKNGGKTVVFASLATAFAHSFVLIFMLSFDYDDLHVAVFRPYSVTAYGMWALWMGYGLGAAVSRLKSGGRTLVAPTVALCAALIPACLLIINLRVNNRSEDRFAEKYADTILQTLPPNAAFLVYGDAEAGPMGYMHFVKRTRPDVELISSQGLLYPNRLFSPLERKKKRRALLWKYIKTNSRPVFLTSKKILEPLPEGFVFTHNGLYNGIQRGTQKGTMQLRFDKKVTDYLRDLRQYDRSPDAWIRHVWSKTVFRAGSWLGYFELAQAPEIERRTRSLRKMIMSDYNGITGVAEVLIEHGGLKHLPQAGQLLESAEPSVKDLSDKERRGRFYYLKGFLAYRLGRIGEARKHFKSSVKHNPHKENPSVDALKKLR